MSFKIIKIIKKKVIICPHPKMMKPKKFFPNFVISKNSTISMIPNSYVVLFSLSSAISLAIYLKKNIISVQSELLGDHFKKLSNKYIRALNLTKINIDQEFLLQKKDIILKNQSSKFYNRFISNKLKIGGNITSDKRIYNEINKNFF